MIAEILRGEVLTTTTIQEVGSETPYREAGFSRVITFQGQKTDVDLLAIGVGSDFYYDLNARLMITSATGRERWQLKESPNSLHYKLNVLIGDSNLGPSLQTGDKLNFHLLRERSGPGTLSVTDLDINRALTEHDPSKVLEFLRSSIALAEALHSAHTRQFSQA